MKNWQAAYLAGIIDGEGTITLTRMHQNEHRRPCITIASTDKELLLFIKSIVGGALSSKKNYNPEKHKDSYTLSIKSKSEVLYILEQIEPYLRVNQKRLRAKFILENYDSVTPRNGKYDSNQLRDKLLFEEKFFQIK
ncbi:MAG: hypothetical protein HLX45_12850 [Bacillus sp. (in: Bacteria)]|nr:hypothetical protein [Bacillus sp. (in: firmicutes)]